MNIDQIANTIEQDAGCGGTRFKQADCSMQAGSA